MRTWQLQEAKNKFSQVVEDAVSRGPQVVTKHGVEVAVVLSYADYKKMAASQEKLSDFFRNSPLAEADIELARDTSPARSDVPL